MRKGQTNYESIVPIVLIILLGIFVAGKFGLVDFSQVPILNAIFPAPPINIAVVGKISPALLSLLQTKTAKYHQVQVMVDRWDPDSVYPGALSNYDIIILQGDRYCPRLARQAVADRVKAGADLIVIGDACTRENPNDPMFYGWDIGIGLLGDVMPVQIGGPTHEKKTLRSEVVHATLDVVDQFHPIFKGYQTSEFYTKVYDVDLKGTGKPLAMFNIKDPEKVNVAHFAVIEGNTNFGGSKVIYFAFDPGETGSENLILNTIFYLKGRKG